MLTLEHQSQVNLMQWWALMHNRFGISEQLLFAIPNGGQRNIIIAKKLKDEGVRAGVPDLFLAVPRGEFHGLFVEMKKEKGGRVSDSQKTMIAELSEAGYRVTVCHGFDEARRCIEEYLADNANELKS